MIATASGAAKRVPAAALSRTEVPPLTAAEVGSAAVSMGSA